MTVEIEKTKEDESQSQEGRPGLVLRRVSQPKLTRTFGPKGSSSVVVEVKRGVAHVGPLVSGTTGVAAGSVVADVRSNNDLAQRDRCLSALRRSQEDKAFEQPPSIEALAAESRNREESNKNTQSQSFDEIERIIDEPFVFDSSSGAGAAIVTQPAFHDIPQRIEDEPPKSKVLRREGSAGSSRKLKKNDLVEIFDQSSLADTHHEEVVVPFRRSNSHSKRKKSVVKRGFSRDVMLFDGITVVELARGMAESVHKVIAELLKLGLSVKGNAVLETDTARLVIEMFGHRAKQPSKLDIEESLLDDKDIPETLVTRPPIVTVMGHVDHGKTSLLDALRASDVVSGEAGGITQHIGAYSVHFGEQAITFIDTAGHEAFTEMRVRGVSVTDIVLLVVAGDDGVKAQTVEAISHAKAAGVPIVVAINKADKPTCDVQRVKNELLSYGLVSDDLGGDVICVPVSALKKTNIDELKQAILLIAEINDLKSNPDCPASGTIIEAKMDKGKGVVVTAIVQRGTLRYGDLIVAGSSFGRIREMVDDRRRAMVAVGPSFAVELSGLNQVPNAGDRFNVVQTEKRARDIVEYRIHKEKESRAVLQKRSVEELFLSLSQNQAVKELQLIIKADVHGSLEAILAAVRKISSTKVKVKVVHSGIGDISPSDVSLAKVVGAQILGFNVRGGRELPLGMAPVRYHAIIYELIDDVKSLMSAMLGVIKHKRYIGSAEVRQVFDVSKFGKIAGSYVTKGIIRRGAEVRLLRNADVIYEGKLRTLKRSKDDVKELKEGFECGIGLDFNDIKVGDIIEVSEIVEEAEKL